MNAFKSLKLATQLVIAFLLVSSISVVVGLNGLTGVSKVTGLMDDAYSNNTVGIGYMANCIRALAAMQMRVAYSTVYTEPKARLDELKKFQDGLNDLEGWMAKERSTNMSDFEKGCWKQLIHPEIS